MVPPCVDTHAPRGARTSLREAQGSLPRSASPCAHQPRAYRVTTGAGCFTAPPGTPYLIDIALKQRVPRSGLRVVRASIDGREINEQVVLRSGSASARFCGWLEDPTGDPQPRSTVAHRSPSHNLQPWTQPPPHPITRIRTSQVPSGSSSLSRRAARASSRLGCAASRGNRARTLALEPELRVRVPNPSPNRRPDWGPRA